MGASGGNGTGGAGGAPCATECGPNSHCAEASCVCDDGFTSDGDECIDVNECAGMPGSCHPSSLCIDQDGSFTCACPPGTEGDPSAGGAGCEARYTQIVAGQLHTCALRKDGATLCSGFGGNGRLGDGAFTNRNAPVQAGAASNWKRLASNDAFTCGLKTSGTLWCWGVNTSGQLGTGNTEQQALPAYLSLDTTWNDVATGTNHTCAVRSDGVLQCWGRNTSGQLGIGSTASPQLTPQSVNVLSSPAPETDWTHVTAARDTTCAQKADGRLYCWGSNVNDETSKAGASSVLAPHLVETAPGVADKDWTEFVTGQTSCGLKASGSLFCWGRNSEGQLGDGTTTRSAIPKLVKPGTTFVRVRTGLAHVCAIATSGQLFCWGRNHATQVKAGENGRHTAPLLVDASTDWSDLALGTSHSCGLKSDGRVLCWGTNGYGATAQSTFGYAITPTPVGASKDWSEVWAFGESTCASKLDGSVMCWGGQELGSFGLGTTASLAMPTPLAKSMTKVAPGRFHACGLTPAGGIECSGNGGSGNLGLGTTSNATTFGPINSAGKPWAGLVWTNVASGESASCALSSTGALYCWGSNCYGQVDATTTTSTLSNLALVAPALGNGWTNLAVGQNHHCGTRADGSLRCWGRNRDGQIGNGKAEESSCTIKTGPFDHGTGWSTSIAAGVSHTCAVKADGTLWCWGDNANGQLGDDTTAAKTVPVAVGTAKDWSRIAAGNATTCGLRTSGALYCWGANSQGQLGVGDLGQRKLPTLTGKANWMRVAVGFSHACGVQTDGSLWCWGSSEFGQAALASSWPSAPAPLAEAP